MNRLAHQITDDGAMIVLRHMVGAPSSIRVSEQEAIRFARALLDALDPAGDTPATRRIEIGRISIDPDQGLTFVDGNRVHLTAREFDFLHVLARHPGVMVRKTQIMDALYGGRDEPDLKIVDVFACKVRNKLRRFGAAEQVETVWSRGYRLVAQRTAGAFEAAAKTKPSAIQTAILSRLENGPATFLELWNLCPDYPDTAIRNAILTLRQRGAVESVGTGRSAIYALRADRAAA